jgi:hypothetical protein
MFVTKPTIGRSLIVLLVATCAYPLWADEAAGAPSTSKPSHRGTAKPAAKPGARPVVPAHVPKSPITISLTSRIRHGILVVALDDVPVFNEEFQKPVFLISQTTTWDPLPVTPGKHKLTAKIYSEKGKTYVSGTYDLDVSRTKGIELRIRMKGDKLTVEPAS